MRLRLPRHAAALTIPLLLLLTPGRGTPQRSADSRSAPHMPLFQVDRNQFPGGREQRDAILKAEHEQNLKDAARLIELSEQLKRDLEENTRFVLSVQAIKMTDDIEKLAKKIRSRMHR